MTPPEGVQVRGRWQARLHHGQDVCPECGHGKSKQSPRCRECHFAWVRRSPSAREQAARDLAAYWQEREAA